MVNTLERPPVNRKPALTGDAAIYVRISSHKQEDGASLDVQLEVCRRYCDNAGLNVVAEFKEVQSGLDIDRPLYQEALRLARTKAINKLVVYRYDRVGRDDAEYAGILKDFTKQGTELVSASGEGPDLFTQKITGLLAWNESRNLSIRVTGSKMKRHSEGKWGGKAPFGYTTEKRPGGSVLIPRGGEAVLVAEMFTMYASGKYSLSDLRDFLNDAGVLKSRYAINYILRNQTYTGKVPHGRYVNSQFHQKPEGETWVEGQHTPLVDAETFDRVQDRLSQNQHHQRGGTAPRYLFSGLITCGTCGRKYVGRHTNKGRGGKEWNWYACNRRTGVGDCQSHTIYESRVRAAVISPLEKMIAQVSQQDLRQQVRATLARQQEDAWAEGQASKMGAAEELKRLESRLSQWEDMAADGDMPRARFVQRRDEVLPRIQEIRKQIQEHPRPAAAPDLDQFFAVVDALAGEPLDDREWRHMVEGTLEKVVIEGRDIKVQWREWFAKLVESVMGEG